MKRKTVFAIDLDGVLFDLEGSFCEKFGYNNRNEYNLFKRYPEVDPALINEFLTSPDTYADLTPIFGGHNLVWTIKSRNMGVIFLSNRPKHTEEATQMAFDRYSLTHCAGRKPTVHFTPCKSEFIRNYNLAKMDYEIKVLVDDNPVCLEGLKEIGVHGVCWAQPWNQGVYPRVSYHVMLQDLMVQVSETSPLTYFWSGGKNR